MNALRLRDEAASLVDLCRRDQAAALSAFNRMGADHQVDLIANASPHDKKELLFLTTDLPRVVQGLRGRDMYLALEHATASEFDVLIERVGPQHLNFMLSMGCWRKDDIDNGRFLDWLSILNNCDTAGGYSAISHIDANFLAAGLRPHIGIVCESPQELESRRHTGGQWFFTPSDCECDDETVEEFVNNLYAIDQMLFSMVMAKLAFDDAGEILAEARAAYIARLKEEGLPTYEEAVGVYESLRTAAQKRQSGPPSPQAGLVAQDTTTLFLTRALEVFHAAAAAEDSVARADEFSRLLSRISVADGQGMDSESRRRVVRKAEVYASLGLESLSKGDLDAAADLLATQGLTAAFQAGAELVSRVHALVKRLRAAAGMTGADDESPKVDARQYAAIMCAGDEIPRRLLENATPRAIRSLADYEALMRDLAAIARVLGCDESRKG
jgi:hypothetical protein